MWYNKATHQEYHRFGRQKSVTGNASVRVPYRGGCVSRAVTAYPLRYARVGASIARPRYNPPPIAARRCKFVPGWVCEFASACCIFFVFTADGQWPPLHTGMCPALPVCAYGCTDVRNFLGTPIRFSYVYPQSHSHQTSHAQSQTIRENADFQSRG